MVRFTDDWYQKRAWKENRNRIIKLLNSEPLTFKQVIDNSGLSRAVVNDHLTLLAKEGVIKKIYDSGKILNVLQRSKIDLVEWFLSHLEALEMPKETMRKGREILNNEILIFSSLIYTRLWEAIIRSFTSFPQKRKKGKILSTFRIGPVFPTRKQFPTFNSAASQVSQKEDQEIVKMLLPELNPYLFTVILAAYEFEKNMHDTHPKMLENRDKFFFLELSDSLKKSFNKVSEWWFNEVMSYLPSSALFQTLTLFYYNAILQQE